MYGISGSRFQAAGNKDEKENVATEYEDKTYCLGHHHRTNPHHYLVCLPWLQMLVWMNMRPPTLHPL